MSSPLPERLAALGGVLFVLTLVAAFAAYAAVGTVDGEPAAAWGEALKRNAGWAQLSGYLHALAGLFLAAFAWALTGLPGRGREGVPRAWGRFAGLAWASSFVAGGAVIFASAELANYQAHPEGAKTALVLGHLMYANPIAALLAGAFAAAAGMAGPAALPAWFRPFSVALGGLAMLVTLLGSVGGIGLLGMAPVALWLLAAAVVVPWALWRRPAPPARASG